MVLHKKQYCHDCSSGSGGHADLAATKAQNTTELQQQGHAALWKQRAVRLCKRHPAAAAAAAALTSGSNQDAKSYTRNDSTLRLRLYAAATTAGHEKGAGTFLLSFIFVSLSSFLAEGHVSDALKAVITRVLTMPNMMCW